MPNWVQNEIIFENASDEKVAALIRELKLATESDEREFDFNKLIPMPESLDIEEGSNTDLAIAYYVTDKLTIPLDQTNLRELIHRSFNDDWATEVISRLRKSVEERDTEYLDELYTKGKQYMYNHEHYGCYTWYHWCCRYWGTKWNACEAYWSLEAGILEFQTAWSAPFPIVEAIAAKYPELEFTHRWADEDIGSNCGEMWYSEGCGSNVDIDDERTFALRVWGYTEDDFDDFEDDEYDGEETNYECVVQDDVDPEIIEIEDPETVDSGLSISDLI